jgi:hypothetical protein
VTPSCILVSRHDYVLSFISTSSPVSLLTTTKAAVFCFVVCASPPNILTSEFNVSLLRMTRCGCCSRNNHCLL